ncbi:hypothetical protein ABT267_27580, partial [Nonomuraea sp. NPDC001023]
RPPRARDGPGLPFSGRRRLALGRPGLPVSGGLKPADTLAVLTEFLETRVSKVALYGSRVPEVGAWRARLRPADLELVEKVARQELTRLGYLPS